MDKKSLRILICIILVLYLIWFSFFSLGVEKVIIGITILSLLLINSFLDKRIQNKKDKAAHETFYDAIKFIAFGFFSIIYPTLKNVPYLIFILLFVIILYIINRVKIISET
jgi:hypothetical protein